MSCHVRRLRPRLNGSTPHPLTAPGASSPLSFLATSTHSGRASGARAYSVLTNTTLARGTVVYLFGEAPAGRSTRSRSGGTRGMTSGRRRWRVGSLSGPPHPDPGRSGAALAAMGRELHSGRRRTPDRKRRGRRHPSRSAPPDGNADGRSHDGEQRVRSRSAGSSGSNAIAKPPPDEKGASPCADRQPCSGAL